MNDKACVTLRMIATALALGTAVGTLSACRSERYLAISSTVAANLEQFAPRALDRTVLVPLSIVVRDDSLTGVVVVLSPEDSISSATYVAGRVLLTGNPTEYLVLEGPDGSVSGVAVERSPLFGRRGYPAGLESATGPDLGVEGVAARYLYVPFDRAPIAGLYMLRPVAKRIGIGDAGPDIVDAPVTVEFTRVPGESF